VEAQSGGGREPRCQPRGVPSFTKRGTLTRTDYTSVGEVEILANATSWTRKIQRRRTLTREQKKSKHLYWETVRRAGDRRGPGAGPRRSV
jgi:hypothetical protein